MSWLLKKKFFWNSSTVYLTKKKIAKIMQKLFEILNILHTELNLIHRIVQRNNILINSRTFIHIKLIDFEYSSMFDLMKSISIFMKSDFEFEKTMKWTKFNFILINKSVIKYQFSKILKTYHVNNMTSDDTWKKYLSKKAFSKKEMYFFVKNLWTCETAMLFVANLCSTSFRFLLFLFYSSKNRNANWFFSFWKFKTKNSQNAIYFEQRFWDYRKRSYVHCHFYNHFWDVYSIFIFFKGRQLKNIWRIRDLHRKISRKLRNANANVEWSPGWV